MEIAIYSIPFIIAIILLFVFRKYVVWWEYICLIFASVLLSIIIKGCCVAEMEQDTEYIGGYMVKITHYDEWDEWIEETCTRTVHDGYDKDGNEITHEEKYDCSYRKYHPERWKYTDDRGYEDYFFYKEDFDRAMKELGNPKMHFRDMHRHYYTIDGDAQDYYWDNTQHIRPLVRSHSYKNKINASNSVFKFENISDEQADELGLFRYPKIIDDDQDVVLGFRPPKYTHKKFKYINSLYGPKHQFRIYVLVFSDKPVEISEKQKHYWRGGNENEFVVCLGYNTKTGKIDWCNPFSWCDKPELEVATKRYFREHPRMYLGAYPDWLMQNLHLWHGKDFNDFNYIKNEPTHGQSIAILIATIIINMILAVFLIANEFINEDDNDESTISCISYAFSSFTGSISDMLSEWWHNTVIPALDELEKSYRNIHTWK